jgi:hypothetical protein
MINAFVYKVKKQPYFFFILNVVLFFAAVFVLDRVCGKLLRHYYFKQSSGVLYRTTYAMEKTTAPLLVLGSSRANHHYVPEVFEKNLGMEYYNGGRDGSHIFYHYAVLKSALKRYTPKVVIFDFTLSDLQVKEDSYDRLSSLLPYYATHEEIRPIVALKSSMEKLKLCSDVYPFNSSLFTIIKGNKPAQAAAELKAKGFLPLYKTWTQPIAPPPPTDNIDDLDTVKVKYFEMFVRDCKAAGVKLYVVFSPIYVKYPRTPAAIETAKKIAEAEQVEFYDFSTDTTFTANPSLFSDRSHLNTKGAEVYSEKFAALIRQSLQQPANPGNILSK